MSTTAQLAPECVRCRRSEWEHLAQDRGEADDLRRRIWRALGHPCHQFTLTLAEVFAGNQAATSRWARPGQRAQPSVASRGADTYSRGAALARQALARRKEAS